VAKTSVVVINRMTSAVIILFIKNLRKII